jgi:hypothetical protein
MQRRLVPFLKHEQLGCGTVDEPVSNHFPPLACITPRYMKLTSANLSVDGVEVLSPMDDWFLPEFDRMGNRVTSRHDRLGALCCMAFADLSDQINEARKSGDQIMQLVMQRFGGKPLAVFTIDLAEFPSEDELRRDIFIDKNGIVYLQAYEDSHRGAGFYMLAEMQNFLRNYGEDFI